MVQFAANLTMLFTEHAFLDRFAAAADAGFTAVEFLSPYEYESGQIADALEVSGLRLVLHNLPSGNWAGGERGIGCLPDRTDEFRAGVARAIEYASALGCTRLNCLAGIAAADDAAARRTLVENLRFAAEALRGTGITLLLEPVNTRDVPGFFVSRTTQALAILDEVGDDKVKLQFDIYHTQVMEGDLARSIETHFDRIGHLQLADNPGRNEPGTGEINYRYLFGKIDALGYDGWIGCEYKPKHATAAGLGWIRELCA
ncbi:2-oxo-tetronate isomerase [Lichenicoccus sp.]|uniref:2-oxo-tetronate isomerase n=1 Tax=Lichenicoccus sp. TaxID=2781899 RepID=UPI003D0E90CC